jgi:hypothetical protein
MLAERQGSNSETSGVSIDFPGVQCVSPACSPFKPCTRGVPLPTHRRLQ